MNMLSLQPLPILADALPREVEEPPDQKGCEFIDGQWVEMSMGAEAGVVTANVLGLLRQPVQQQDLGLLFAQEAGYQIFPAEPLRTRKPDGSFIRHGRLPGDKPPRGYIKIPPDLALEVVSPNDLAEEVNAKVMEYLRAGVRLLWVIYPSSRSVYVFRPGGSMSWLTEEDTLSGEDVVPGFSCRVADLFAGI